MRNSVYRIGFVRWYHVIIFKSVVITTTLNDIVTCENKRPEQTQKIYYVCQTTS